jgi:hypothetical protein
MDQEKQRDFHRSQSDPMICQTVKKVRIVSKMTRQSFFFSLKSIRTLILSISFLFTSGITSLTTVYAYSHMPVRRALPDVIFDNWCEFALWRGSPFVTWVPIPSIVTAVLLFACVYYTHQGFSVCNIRKHIAILCVAFVFRSVVVFVTQLPPPCHGFPNCPCGRVSFADLRQKSAVFWISMVYFGTFGFGFGEISGCGCGLMSGHVALQVVLALYLIDTMKFIVSQDKVNAVKFTGCVLIGLSLIYSVFIRSEYTVGVVLSVLFVMLVALIYRIGQIMCECAWGPFVMTPLGRWFMCLEREADDPEDDVDP